MTNMEHRYKQHAENAINYTANLINKFGARLTGTPACLQAAEHLKESLDKQCGNAKLETFETHPGVFNGFFIIEPILYSIFTLAAFFGYVFLGACGQLLTVIYGILQFGTYKEYFKFLYPKKECSNVVATLEPQSEVRQQIIISGHHDSAQEVRLLRHAQKLYGLRVIIPDVFIIIGLLSSFLWIGIQSLTGHAPEFAISLSLLWLVSIPIACTKIFFIGPNGTPGAGDNLIASTSLIEFAKIFSVQTGNSSLSHTRLILASFDAEEAGLRGARAFVKKNLEFLTKYPTYMLNIDSIYEVKELQFLTSDLNNTVALDKPLAELCLQTALNAGYPGRLTQMKCGGGSTDAAELAKIGVRCTSLLAMSTDLIRDGLVYHTMNDLPEAIEPQAVEACLEVCCNVIKQLDNQI